MVKYLKLFEEFNKHGFIKAKLEELRDIVSSTNFDSIDNYHLRYEISLNKVIITFRVNGDDTIFEIDLENIMLNTITKTYETDPQYMNNLDEIFYEIEKYIYNTIGISERYLIS